jgi:hypothetical protein
MKTLTYSRMQIVAVIALVICAMVVVWSASASAYTDPGPPPGHYEDATSSPPPATQSTALPPPVVTLEAPQPAGDNSETLPIVLSSVALLVALGGAGFIVLARVRTRGAPQPGA